MQQNINEALPFFGNNKIGYTRKEYDIAITFDDSYVSHACVMLQSLKVHLLAGITVHCIFNNLHKANRQLLTKQFANSNIRLNFIQFDTKLLPELPIKQTDHVSPAAFFRIWLPYLLPDVKQVLFLDSDIVINGDLRPLLNYELPDCPIAAVPDLVSHDKKLKLGMSANSTYFNSGVMLLNLDYFRQHKLTQQIANFIINHPNLCEFWDQDALNAVIDGNFHQLNAVYNVQRWHFHPSYISSYTTATQNPVIVHYTGGGSCKPWFYQNNHPLKNLYYKYLMQTPFRSYYPPDMPRSWRLFRKIKFMYYKYFQV